MDCQELTPNARRIFEQITEYYPPDFWKNPLWTDNGRVNDNGWYDLRNKNDREKLVKWYEYLIGSTIVTTARRVKNNQQKLTRSVFKLKTCREWVELSVLLHELDFQIETLDQME